MKNIKAEIETTKTLRLMEGLLGIALPILLLVALGTYPDSISITFYSKAGWLFEAILGSLAVLFLCERQSTALERFFDLMAGGGAAMVVIWHCNGSYPYLHFAGAAILFIAFALQCFLVFPRWNTHTVCLEHIQIFLAMGCLIIIGMLIAAVGHIIFLGETIGLEAYGIAYLLEYIKSKKHGNN